MRESRRELCYRISLDGIPPNFAMVDDVVEATDELISEGQGHSKVKHLSELLRQAEASTPMFGCRSMSYL